MFCKKCGAEIVDGGKFCPKCGEPVAPVNPESVMPGNGPDPVAAGQAGPQQAATGDVGSVPPASGGGEPYSAEPQQAAPAPAPKKKMWPWILAACVVVAAIVAIVILVNQPKKVNLEEHVRVDFTGYNTVGNASVYLDTETLVPVFAEILEESEDRVLESGDWEDLTSVVELTLDKESGLSNGDQVTVTITYDNEEIEDYDIQFTGETATYTVEGLGDLEEIDPFADLEVSFTGIAPDGRVEWVYNGESPYISGTDFQCDQTSGLRNGDVVTFSLDYDEAAAINQGYRLTQTTREYTVEGLDEYVDSYEDLTEDFLTAARTESEDVINAYIAQNYSTESAMSDLTYAGYVFLTPKEGGNARNYNVLYMIYGGTVSHSTNGFPTTVVYYPVRFVNILSSGGALTYDEGLDIVGNSTLEDGSWGFYTNGYANPITAYAELVTANVDDYNGQAGDGFEQYASYTPIAALADISEANMQTLTTRAQDIISAYVAGSYNTDSHASELTLVGEYLLVSKAQGTDNFKENNHLIVVFSATVTNDANRFAAATVYFPVQFDGLVNLPDGRFQYTAESDVLGSFNFPDSTYFSNGYLDGAQMFSDLVTANRTDYNYEVSEGLKAFGE